MTWGGTAVEVAAMVTPGRFWPAVIGEDERGLFIGFQEFTPPQSSRHQHQRKINAHFIFNFYRAASHADRGDPEIALLDGNRAAILLRKLDDVYRHRPRAPV